MNIDEHLELECKEFVKNTLNDVQKFETLDITYAIYLLVECYTAFYFSQDQESKIHQDILAVAAV